MYFNEKTPPPITVEQGNGSGAQEKGDFILALAIVYCLKIPLPTVFLSMEE